MWWSRFIFLPAFFLLVACGFQPLYGTSDTGGGRDALAHTQIKPIADRSGQQLRNHLLDLMTPRGQSPTPLYTLAVSLSESTNHIAVRKTALATRANFNLTASFILTDTATGRVLYGDKTQVLSGYNILISDFATLQSVKDARARALREAAEQIRVRLGVFFDQHYNSGSAAP